MNDILKDVMNMDLTGYKFVIGYVLEQYHGPVGYYPALFKKNKVAVICLDKAVLEKIWKLLPKRDARVRELLLLIKEGEDSGLIIKGENGEDTESTHILLEEEFTELERQKDSFGWHTGFGNFTEDQKSARSPFE